MSKPANHKIKTVVILRRVLFPTKNLTLHQAHQFSADCEGFFHSQKSQIVSAGNLVADAVRDSSLPDGIAGWSQQWRRYAQNDNLSAE